MADVLAKLKAGIEALLAEFRNTGTPTDDHSEALYTTCIQIEAAFFHELRCIVIL